MRTNTALIGLLILLAGLAGCLANDAPQGPTGMGEEDHEALNESAIGYTEPRWIEGGTSFDEATDLDPVGLYGSNLADGDHYYKFHTDQGDPINIEIRPFCNTNDCPVLHAGSLGINQEEMETRMSFQLLSPDGLLLDTPNSNPGDSRIIIENAPTTGEYRFHVTSEHGFTGEYKFCFLLEPPNEHPCPDIGERPQEIIFGGSLGDAHTNVLLIPPTHGDLANPNGPTALDYLDAAVTGIHEWVNALHAFADDYPEYDYLREITVNIQLFDGPQHTQDYDIVITYVETGGPIFRGAASPCLDGPRCIVLSLFSQSPRAGQVTPDYPTYNDMHAVTMHEFAHVWGLGHTLTWTHEHGPDLMNSPAPFVYGDGALGGGTLDDPKTCISTLNLYGMALIFGFLDTDATPEEWNNQLPNTYELPPEIPYEWYCTDNHATQTTHTNPNVHINDPNGLLPTLEP